MSTFLTDLRYAIRMLAKVACILDHRILALGLGIGATPHVSVVMGLLAAAYPDPDRLACCGKHFDFPERSVITQMLDGRAGNAAQRSSAVSGRALTSRSRGRAHPTINVRASPR